jgi:hypothetical protein
MGRFANFASVRNNQSSLDFVKEIFMFTNFSIHPLSSKLFEQEKV